MALDSRILENIIFKTCSSINKNKGKELLSKGLISNIQGKKIDDIYHIYGKVEGENNLISTHIKINLKTRKLIGFRCSCKNYSDLMEQGHSYFCEHISATGYKFLQVISKKRESNEDSKKIKKSLINKKELNLDIKIEYKNINDSSFLYCDFKVGKEKMYLISDIKEFLIALLTKNDIKVVESFTYINSKHIISKEYTAILKYMVDKIKSKEENVFKGSKLIIKEKDIYKFISLIPSSEVTFKYNFLEYKAKIKKEILPLAFTISDNLESLIITSEKNLPIKLNRSGSILLFNREIYILNKEIEKIFIPILNSISKNNLIIDKKNEENYYKYISDLCKISSKVILTESVKRYGENLIKCKFNIYKIKGNIYCDVNIYYGELKINILEDSKFKYDNIRNKNFEDKLFIVLENNRFIKRDNKLVFIGNDSELFNIITNKAQDLKVIGDIFLGTGFEKAIINNSFINSSIFDEGSYIKLKYNFQGLDDGEIKELYSQVISGAKFYKTKKGSFIDLEDGGVKEFFDLINVLNLQGKLEDGYSKIEKGKVYLLLNQLTDKKLSFVEGKDKLENVLNKIENIKEENLPLTVKLKKTLRDYQYEGVKWFKELSELGFGGILADDMGLGKTLQTISFLSIEKKKKTLIVTPTSLIFNWKDEFNKFSPRIKVALVYGEKKKRSSIISDYNKYDVLIITYGTLKNHLDEIKDIEFDYCIIDEAQAIKNHKSQVSMTIKCINARVKFALTGTPIENNLSELWSIFDFIMPGYLYNFTDFEKIFNDNSESLAKLKLMINPFILRRTKKEVALDLPDKIEKKLFINMTEVQKAMYLSYVKEIKRKIKETKNNIEIFSYLTKLRQLCLHPAMVIDDFIGNSGKFIAVHKLVSDNLKKKGKTLIFSQFTTVLDLFGEELREKDIPFYTLTGATSSKERINLVNKFNKENDVKVFLISLKAGGTGLNLTSANLVIHFDPWWNPAVESQATDRAYRIGQRRQVQVVKLIAKESIEEKIIALQEEKQELIENILSSEDISKNIINKEVIEDIFNNL